MANFRLFFIFSMLLIGGSGWLILSPEPKKTPRFVSDYFHDEREEATIRKTKKLANFIEENPQFAQQIPQTPLFPEAASEETENLELTAAEVDRLENIVLSLNAGTRNPRLREQIPNSNSKEKIILFIAVMENAAEKLTLGSRQRDVLLSSIRYQFLDYDFQVQALTAAQALFDAGDDQSGEMILTEVGIHNPKQIEIFGPEMQKRWAQSPMSRTPQNPYFRQPANEESE